MTLNITIVSPAGIHQSADFQISKTERGVDGKWIELQPNSSKIVSLRYEKWSGLLTYCGIGLWKGKRTDEYASEWLAELPKSGATFRDAVEKIREQGSAWIASINQSSGKVNIHSFVLAGYEAGTPVYAIVSNYQTLTGGKNTHIQRTGGGCPPLNDRHSRLRYWDSKCRIGGGKAET